MITVVENSGSGDMVNITISVPTSKIEQVGELVNQLTAFAVSLNGSVGAKKKAPTPVKKLNRAERRERNLAMIRGKKAS